MAERLDIYKCDICGIVVEALAGGAGTLVCCNKPMAMLKENTVDAAKEKHVPVIEKIESGYKIKVGSVAHPMLDEHHIAWIELLADGEAHRRFLKPGDAPEATFLIEATNVGAREHCNLHGVWRS